MYFVFYLLGLGTLLPWNFFITVNSFWDYKFRNVTANDTSDEEDQTELQKEFTSYLSIASNVPNAIFVIVNAIYGHNFKLSFRIFTSLGSIIGFFLVITVFAKVNSDGWQIPFLYTILTIVVLINVNTAVFQGGLFGVAGKFPSKYMGSVMAGQAMGGILPALVDIIVLSLDISERDSGFACFTIATLILIMNFALFGWLIRTDFFRHYARDHDDLLPHPEDEHSVIVHHHISFWHILSHSWHYCLSVYLVFTVTLSVFPAVTVLIESHEKVMTFFVRRRNLFLDLNFSTRPCEKGCTFKFRSKERLLWKITYIRRIAMHISLRSKPFFGPMYIPGIMFEQ